MLSGYGPHTAAKHRMLRGYLDAWLPILGQSQTGRRPLVLIDGFAGPGRYDNGRQGSPLVMLDAYLEHEHRDRIASVPHFVFIEKNHAFVSHLRAEVAGKRLGDKVRVDIHHGVFAEEFPRVIDADGVSRRRAFEDAPARQT